MMPETPKRKSAQAPWWIATIRKGFFPVFFAILLFWLLSMTATVASRISALRIQIFQENQEISNLSSLKKDSQAANALMPQLQMILPNMEQLLSVSSDLENFAAAARLQQSFAFGAESPATPGEAKSVGFTVGLTGGLANFLAYLRNVEREPYIVNFEQIEITTQPTGTYQLNGTGKIFSQ